MKIAYSFGGFTQKYGGVSLYFSRLALELGRIFQDVRIYAPITRNKNLHMLPKGYLRGLQFSDFPPKSGGVIEVINEVVSRNLISNWAPDVLHETYYSKGGGARSPAPRIITIYDMIHELFPQYFSPTDKTRFLKKQSIDNADHIIVISEKTKDDLRLLYDIPEEKISCIHLGIDRPSHNLHLIPFENIRPYILYVGSRIGYKNFMGMISGIATSNKLLNEFDVIAIGGGKFSPEELSQIHSLGFGENQVRQLDADIGELGAYYSRAAIFVYPSIYEGFGLPPLEAMSYGCPVVASNAGSIPEVLKGAATFFDPLDFGQIAHAIENVIFSHDVSADLCRQGFMCANSYTWESCARKTLAVYESVCHPVAL
jgi:glycosyltransferase involved in cell wall biosynthesis